MSIEVKLIAETNLSPEILASHAAKICYEKEVPEVGKLIDIKSRLFTTGHHTTLQHNNFTFMIDGISVSSVYFGLHLTHPFYNSDQRSGRFSKMYNSINLDDIKNHLLNYFKETDVDIALSFINYGLSIYKNNIKEITELAGKQIQTERPLANDKYIELNAIKIAQEQLRMFISMIMPTALDYTINLSSLFALYRTAWNPELRDIISKMVKEVIKKYPNLSYMFDEKQRSSKDWTPINNNSHTGIKFKPSLDITNMYYDDSIFNVSSNKDSVDVFYFSPENMNNSIQFIIQNIEVSCATFGQDQRHRTIKRGVPNFSGNFYIPPLLKEAGLEKEAVEYIKMFNELKIPKTLLTMIAPYGIMVKYTKMSDINALLHEQAKRTCWCAQEEIYHLSTVLRKELINKIGKDAKLIKELSPACFKGGICIEGVRFCGRNINERFTDTYFKERTT